MLQGAGSRRPGRFPLESGTKCFCEAPEKRTAKLLLKACRDGDLNCNTELLKAGALNEMGSCLCWPYLTSLIQGQVYFYTVEELWK